MSDNARPTLDSYIATTAASIVADCTRCGDCVRACPVVPFAGLTETPPGHVVGGVLDTLRDSVPLAGAAATWTSQCNGCGHCIPACPEGINPRNMIMHAITLSARQATATPQLFRKMTRGIRLMAAMQLLPDDLARLMRPPPPREAPVVFYLGCNAIRTPHILYNTMYVLDALAIDYEVLGGPAACCGIIHSKWEGEIAAGERVTDATLDRFASFKAEKVLSWCPSCQLHLGETLGTFRRVEFDFGHVTTFLVEHEAALRARMTTPVEMRVLLHAHEGMADLGDNVARLLAAVPGLTIVDTVRETGYTCGGSGADRSPALKAVQREETLRRVRETKVDALVTLYHGCHLQIATAGREQGFGVVNFTDLLVRALGGMPREDVLETLRLLGDWRAMVDQAAPRLRANGIDFDLDRLAALLPDIFTLAEFRGGLDALARPRTDRRLT